MHTLVFGTETVSPNKYLAAETVSADKPHQFCEIYCIPNLHVLTQTDILKVLLSELKLETIFHFMFENHVTFPLFC